MELFTEARSGQARAGFQEAGESGLIWAPPGLQEFDEEIECMGEVSLFGVGPDERGVGREIGGTLGHFIKQLTGAISIGCPNKRPASGILKEGD